MEYNDLKKEKFPQLFELLFSHAETKISPQGAIRINSEKVDHKNFSEWYINLCKEPAFKEFGQILFIAPTPNVFFEDFRRGLKLHQAQRKYGGLKGVDVIKDFTFNDLVPFVSIENVNIKMFYNVKSGEIYPLDHKVYELTEDKDSRRVPIRAVIKFNPYRPEQIYVGDSDYGKECTHINTFKRPEWQLPRELTVEERKTYCKLPSIIDRFMSHLFPDDNCRNFVYDWLHYALTKRCETYLVLNGAKGIGKGIFTDHLCKALIGKKNHLIAPPGGLDSQFNAMLKDKRMIVFDEFRIDEEDKINKLKRYINKEQTIEHKGQDIADTIETFNSFIISSNGLADMRISWDDRRFSVADIAETKLDEVWSKSDIQELIEELEDGSESMQQFGYWLLYRRAADNEFAVYKGNHFYKLCYSSLPEWSRVIIDEVFSAQTDSIDDAELRLAYKNANPMGKFPQAHKVADFLRNYKHEGKHYLGEFKRDGKGWYIKVDSHFYKPIGQDNTNIQWEDIL
jgi:hypothetical protein